MPRSIAAVGRVNNPNTSSTGVVSSMLTVTYAKISGGTSGTLYSSANSATAVSQFASLVMAEFQNTVATARRKGMASRLYGTASSQCSTRAIKTAPFEPGAAAG